MIDSPQTWKLYTALVKDRKPLHRFVNNELKYIYLCLGKDLYLRLLNTRSHRYEWLEHSKLCHEIVKFQNEISICA